MFGFLSGVPSRVRHLHSGFRRCFTRPQFDNFCRVMLGLMVAGENQHDVKSVNELFVEGKDQSSLNRFFTEPSWDVEQVVSEEGSAPERGDEELTAPGAQDRGRRRLQEVRSGRRNGLLQPFVDDGHHTRPRPCHLALRERDGGVSVHDGLKLYGSEKRCKE